MIMLLESDCDRLERLLIRICTDKYNNSDELTHEELESTELLKRLALARRGYPGTNTNAHQEKKST